MNCPRCGAAAAENASICPNCGLPLSAGPVQPPVQPPVPPQMQPPVPPQVQPGFPQQQPKKPVYKKWWFWVIIAVVGIVILASVSGNGNNSQENTGDPSSAQVTDTQNDDRTEAPSTKENKEPTYEIVNTYFDYYAQQYTDSVEQHIVVEIKNTGSVSLYVSGCGFDVNDTEGHLVTTGDLTAVPQIVAPGESCYLYNSLDLLMPDGVSASDEFKLEPKIKVAKAKSEAVNYEISDTAMKKDSFGYPVVTGRVTNNSGNDDSLVNIGIVYFDADGRAVGVDTTYIDDLADGETESFQTSSMMMSDSLDVSTLTFKVFSQKEVIQF